MQTPAQQTQNSATPLWDKATIIPVEKQLLDLYWPYVQGYILRALEYTDGELTLSEVRSDIESSHRQLWIIKDKDQYIAAVITRIEDRGSVKIGEITFAAGKDHKKWDHFTDLVGHWFKTVGCTVIDIVGRKGWEKLYADRGFKSKYVVLRKDL